MPKSGKKTWNSGVKAAERGITPVRDQTDAVYKAAFGGKKPKLP